MKKQTGGKVGKPLIDPERGYQRSHRVTLDDKTVDTLRIFGGGNLSAGCRKAAKMVDNFMQMGNSKLKP